MFFLFVSFPSSVVLRDQHMILLDDLVTPIMQNSMQFMLDEEEINLLKDNRLLFKVHDLPLTVLICT